ncbi:unnamed protein product [Hymenolepis diminuta]|nr:unnamed protein product [Hymenolepis diminuta]
MWTNDYAIENSVEFQQIENLAMLMAWGGNRYVDVDGIYEPLRISSYNFDYQMYLALVATGKVVDLAEQQYVKDSFEAGDDYDDFACLKQD